MSLNLRNRIALYYMTATAVLTALVFVVIYAVVHNTVYNHLDGDLESERDEVENSLFIDSNRIIFANVFEWKEWEHGQIEINPSFIEVIDTDGNIIKETGNLLKDSLEFHPERTKKVFFDARLMNGNVRQVQSPLKDRNGNTIAYLIIAIPRDEIDVVLNNLKLVLVSTFPVVILILFLLTRVMAGKSISPLNKVISSADHITNENLDERISPPLKKDEIYTLSTTINGLLDRLQDGVLREKQFTADASHELRTPLSVIKGTLEVLIRKPRDEKQYKEKITYCINEVNRMSNLIDELLMLARYESGKIMPVMREIELNESVEYSIFRLKNVLDENCIRMNIKASKKYYVKADPSMLDVILENLLSNAVKYSNGSKLIDITLGSRTGKTVCVIKDYGLGMSEEHISKIFDRFYRGDKSRSSLIAGHGLGLAIVKRLADLQNMEISVKSEIAKGTTVLISFPN